MENLKVKNAIIEDVKISKGPYGCLTFTLNLTLQNHAEGSTDFGNFIIASSRPMDNLEAEQDYSAYFINKVMEVVNVYELSDLKYKSIRAIMADSHKCVGIQNFLKDGLFFIPGLTKDDDISGIFTEPEIKESYMKNIQDCYKRQNTYDSEFYHKLQTATVTD